MVKLLLVFVAACSIPSLDLDGKQCPCTEGFACDTALNLCRPANADGGIIDTPAVTPCLGMLGGDIYRYSGTFNWQKTDATWSGTTQITQTSNTIGDSYAFPTSEVAAAMGNFRVIATLRPLSSSTNTPSLGIVLRAQGSGSDRYECNWLPKTHELRIAATSQGNTVTLGTAPASTVLGQVTMEARITGSPPTLACCLRESSAAKLMNINDTGQPISGGYPGLATNRQAATFPSFAVYAP